VSSLTRTPDDMFQGQPGGGNFKVFGMRAFSNDYLHVLIISTGFEYYADSSKRDDGFITWYADNKPSHRMGAAAVGPDTGPDGTGVGQRIIPEEPMVCVSSCRLLFPSLLYLGPFLMQRLLPEHYPQPRHVRQLAEDIARDDALPGCHACRLCPRISTDRIALERSLRPGLA
jgi:hypothetical protein